MWACPVTQSHALFLALPNERKRSTTLDFAKHSRKAINVDSMNDKVDSLFSILSSVFCCSLKILFSHYMGLADKVKYS